ncbi:DUF4031 domain-containing protein [Nocardioides mesophilus]|uniref:DUF4031 domain-containing protein n=1 Tax=Nocardioides mesophilus TaxID=433659 RepID=A0A7G9RDX7_9ACTN|nr:DUF4031 domain-containing protein [Nocardioides mesophilus]QNN53802.1 DUF4031 domain-containing protein [Nocardioides mesophilus]
MTLLIDPPNAPGHGRMWSHLASDWTFAELHRFAAGLGVPRRGFDGDHYDVPAERYHDVVAAGATPASSRELIDRLRAAGLRRRQRGALRPTAPGVALLRAPRLEPGDRLAVVAPAGPVPADRLAAGVAVLEGWGFEVRAGSHVLGRDQHLDYLAAADEHRAADLQAALLDPGVRGVVCARGGYGVQRMLDLVDWAAVARVGPKVLVGFSDVTALHQALAARLGWSSVHGPVVTSLGSGDDSSRAQLRLLLTEPERLLSPFPEPLEVLHPGRAEGVLVGGNLALLTSTVGTAESHGAAGSVVVLEDVAEETYRLDRMVTHLLRSGWFAGCRGVLLGDFTEGDDPAAVRSMLADRLAPLGVPVLAGAPVGHGPRNLALPLGVPATLDGTGATGSLRLRYPALA